MNRFAGFNTEEIGILLQGLLFDDGLEYVPEPGSVEERLVAELHDRMRSEPLNYTGEVAEAIARGADRAAAPPRTARPFAGPSRPSNTGTCGAATWTTRSGTASAEPHPATER